MRVSKAHVVGGVAALAATGIAWKYFQNRKHRDESQRETCGAFPVDEDLYPFEHHFLDMPDGTRLHYIDEGPRDAAHTLVFMHGNPTWSLLYRHIIEDLQSTYRCIAPDYPGFGLSTATPGYSFKPREISSTVESFLEQLKPEPFTMMVQDWGGPIGLGLAGRRPEFIKSLVIGNSWAWPAKPGGRKAFFSKFMGGPIGQFMARYFNGVTRILMYVGSSKGLGKEEYRMYLRPFQGGKDRARPTAVLPREIVNSADYLKETEDGLRNIADRPTLIVWGTDDWAFSPKDLERFEQTFPKHKTVLLEGASHFIQKDAPHRISKAIRDFFESDTVYGTRELAPKEKPVAAKKLPSVTPTYST